MTTPWMTPDESAEYCRMSRAAFNRWVTNEGIRPDGVVGRSKRYLPRTLDSVMATIAKRPLPKRSRTRVGRFAEEAAV